MEKARRESQDKEAISALAAQGQSAARGKKDVTRNKRKSACFKSGKIGHWKRDCKQVQSDGSKQGRGDSSKQSQSDSSKQVSTLVSTLFISDNSEQSKDTWYLDSGATDHMSGDVHKFVDFRQFKSPVPIRVGNGNIINASGWGNVYVLAYDSKHWTCKYLKDVYLVPDLRYNLFSMRAALDKGLRLEAHNEECRFLEGNKVVAIGERDGKLFKMKFREVAPKEAFVEVTGGEDSKISNRSLQEWHEKLAHQNFRRILRGAGIETKGEDPYCEACVLGKAHRQPFPASETQTSEVGELVHADLCGAMEQNSFGNSRYFLLFKDDFSQFRKLYFLQNKTEVVDCFRNYLQRVVNETGRNVKTFRTDNGLEFVNEEMRQIVFDQGIRHERTVAYTPEQNGKAEREDRTLVESARTMLQSKSLDKRFWAEAINTAAFVLNRSVPIGPRSETPYELWCGKKMDVKDFKNFGDEVFTHVPKQRRKKWHAKAKPRIFVGYSEVSKAYRIWSAETNKIEVLRDVFFKRKGQSVRDDGKEAEEPKCDLEVPVPKRVDEEAQREIIEIDDDTDSEEPDELMDVDSQRRGQRGGRQLERDAGDSGSQRQLRDREQLRAPDRYPDYASSSLFLMEGIEPKNFQEALESDRSQQWKEAMDEELAALEKNKTWILTEPPKKETVLPNRWVFKVKLKDDGTIDRYRARLVVKSFLQRPGLDYFGTFSPVVKFDSIQMMLALAAAHQMHIEQFDVKTAFLHGELKESVDNMEQPAGFENGS